MNIETDCQLVSVELIFSMMVIWPLKWAVLIEDGRALSGVKLVAGT